MKNSRNLPVIQVIWEPKFSARYIDDMDPDFLDMVKNEIVDGAQFAFAGGDDGVVMMRFDDFYELIAHRLEGGARE